MKRDECALRALWQTHYSSDSCLIMFSRVPFTFSIALSSDASNASKSSSDNDERLAFKDEVPTSKEIDD